MVEITSSPRFVPCACWTPLSIWHRRRRCYASEKLIPSCKDGNRLIPFWYPLRRAQCSHYCYFCSRNIVGDLSETWDFARRFLEYLRPHWRTPRERENTKSAFRSELVFAKYSKNSLYSRRTLNETYDILPAIVRNADFIFDLLIALIHADGYVTK